jgi:hypothetical protein
MRVYIGSDRREQAAVDVAVKTLAEVSGINAELLRADRLADAGLLGRITDTRGGQAFDMISGAPMSTEFAISRFLVPILCQQGFALFTDCDMVFLRDPRDMLAEIEPGKAVYVVQHDHRPVERFKMVNQVQTTYPRKNWSSVMLFDCDHPANRRLTLRDVNWRSGRDLHGFYWLHDSEIGRLDSRWNWLVNVQPQPEHTGIAHFTLGGPFNPGWQPADHDDLWLKAAA